jgi:hypothetical protein
MVGSFQPVGTSCERFSSVSLHRAQRATLPSTREKIQSQLVQNTPRGQLWTSFARIVARDHLFFSQYHLRARLLHLYCLSIASLKCLSIASPLPLLPLLPLDSCLSIITSRTLPLYCLSIESPALPIVASLHSITSPLASPSFSIAPPGLHDFLSSTHNTDKGYILYCGIIPVCWHFVRTIFLRFTPY